MTGAQMWIARPVAYSAAALSEALSSLLPRHFLCTDAGRARPEDMPMQTADAVGEAQPGCVEIDTHDSEQTLCRERLSAIGKPRGGRIKSAADDARGVRSCGHEPRRLTDLPLSQ